MSLISLIVVLIIVGAVLNYVPMDARIRGLIYALILILVVFMLLDVAGLMSWTSPRVGCR